MPTRTIDQTKEFIKSFMTNEYNRGKFRPFIFFLNQGQTVVIPIFVDFFRDDEGKLMLAQMIRDICKMPFVTLAGLAFEAHMAKIDVTDNTSIEEAVKQVAGKKVSQMPDKVDAITAIFSSPEGESAVMYQVDERNHRVLQNLSEEAKSITGTFSHFFEWNLN